MKYLCDHDYDHLHGHYRCPDPLHHRGYRGKMSTQHIFVRASLACRPGPAVPILPDPARRRGSDRVRLEIRWWTWSEETPWVPTRDDVSNLQWNPCVSLPSRHPSSRVDRVWRHPDDPGRTDGTEGTGVDRKVSEERP